MDKKLARGYALEYIQKQSHLTDGIPNFITDLQDQITSRISIEKSIELHLVMSKHLSKIDQMNPRKAIYSAPYYLPVNEYEEGCLLVTVLSMQASLNSIKGHQDLAFAKVNLHALSRLTERLNEKPSPESIDMENLVTWVAIYKAAFGGLDGSIPILVPHSRGLYFGQLDYWGDSSLTTLVKYSLSRARSKYVNVRSGYTMSERKPCTINTFVGVDDLRFDQIELRKELMEFKDRATDFLKFALYPSVCETCVTERAGSQFHEFVGILERNSIIFKEGIKYLDKEVSDDEYEKFSGAFDDRLARYLARRGHVN